MINITKGPSSFVYTKEAYEQHELYAVKLLMNLETSHQNNKIHCTATNLVCTVLFVLHTQLGLIINVSVTQ